MKAAGDDEPSPGADDDQLHQRSSLPVCAAEQKRTCIPRTARLGAGHAHVQTIAGSARTRKQKCRRIPEDVSATVAQRQAAEDWFHRTCPAAGAIALPRIRAPAPTRPDACSRVEARAEPNPPAPRSPPRPALSLARERFAEKRVSGSRPRRVVRRSCLRPEAAARSAPAWSSSSRRGALGWLALLIESGLAAAFRLRDLDHAVPACILPAGSAAPTLRPV